MNGLPLLGAESHLRFSFLNMLNDPNLTIDPNLSVGNLTVGSDMPVHPLAPVDPIAPINPILPVDPNLTVQDLVNPENEYEIRERHRHLPKRRMPYIENRHFPVTETQATLAGIHIANRNGLGFLLRMFGGEYWKMSPQFQ